jgi:hypothetical protein
MVSTTPAIKRSQKGFGKNNAYFPKKIPGREHNVRGARIWLVRLSFSRLGCVPPSLLGLPLVLPWGPATGGHGCAPQWRPTHCSGGTGVPPAVLESLLEGVELR